VETLIEYLPVLAGGAVLTAALAVLSLGLATLIGGLAAAARVSGGPVGQAVVLAYTTIIRGVPDLVLLLLIYFGGQRLANGIAGLFGGGPVSLSPFLSGVIALGLLYGAYLAETFRGAYLTVPRGQTEAARALGLGRVPLVLRVILPQLVRFALPGYVNVWQVLVKSTAVVSVIGLSDLVGLATQAGRATRQPFLFLVAVLAFYLFVTWISTSLFGLAERRSARGVAGAR
jgi:His/Glu/Gln/Arg/opine family amino acid ABC transporter permease subunit